MVPFDQPEAALVSLGATLSLWRNTDWDAGFGHESEAPVTFIEMNSDRSGSQVSQ